MFVDAGRGMPLLVKFIALNYRLSGPHDADEIVNENHSTQT